MQRYLKYHRKVFKKYVSVGGGLGDWGEPVEALCLNWSNHHCLIKDVIIF